MKPIRTVALVLLALSFGVVVTMAWRRSNHKEELKNRRESAVSRFETIASEQHIDRLQRLDRTGLDPSVCRSILQGLTISCETQSQWKQDKELLLQVNLDKPLGKTYLVDAVERSCVLYANRRPIALLRQDDHRRDPLSLLEADCASFHFVFRLIDDIPDGAELMIEWLNYNPRTKQLERLQSEPCAIRSIE
jgi:hypothetical protein